MMDPLLTPAMNEFMDHLEKTLPEGLLTAPQLVKAGIIKSATTLYNWQIQKKGPPYLRLSTGVCRYLKKDILNWIKEGFSDGPADDDKGAKEVSQEDGGPREEAS